jgi:methylated-DNA-[protein]-cysteine S-methyltransferase
LPEESVIMNGVLTYTDFSSPIGSLWVCASDSGVCGISLQPAGFRGLIAHLSKRFGTVPIVDTVGLVPIVEELSRFLEGESDKIALEADLRGLTPFQQKVLRVMQEIPYGTVRSYQWMAERVGNPKACRAVGRVCAANPVPLLIPCHRVIAKDGSIGGFSSGEKTKKWLLSLERRRRFGDS